MFKAFLCHNGLGITTKSKLDPLLRHLPFPFSRLIFCSSSTSHHHSFVVSYLINNFGFSPESALRASKLLHLGFKTPEKPDSVVTFFRNHGFSESVIRSIIRREPWLLSCDANKRLLPKFQFLLSKGASTSDIVRMVALSPRFLQSSLEKRIIPGYDLLNSFLQSEKRVLSCVILCPYLLSLKCVAPNLNLLVDNNVSTFNIIQILHKTPYRNIICSTSLGKTVQEVKDMGFDPSKSYFGVALLAKNNISKSKWDEKIDTYKRWGWSEEEVFEAFGRQPSCMLASNDKINRVMQFWINQFGCDSSYLVKGPVIFSYSLEKRVIPRAWVLQYLLSKGLRSKRASLLLPFTISEKQFLQKFVKCFGEEETDQLMKLYKGKMNSIEDIGAQGNHDMSCS